MLSPKPVQSRAGKYVAFKIGRRYFAVEAARIRNVMPAAAITALPNPIDGVRGVVRISGRTIPILDVSARLHLQSRSPGPRSAVMLVALDDDPRAAWVGFAVDKLTEVLDVHERDIRGNIVQLRADGRPYGRPKTLLDVASLMPPEEMGRLSSALAAEGELW